MSYEDEYGDEQPYDEDDPSQYEGDDRFRRVDPPLREAPLPIGQAHTEDTMIAMVKVTRAYAIPGGNRGEMWWAAAEIPCAIQPGWDAEMIGGQLAAHFGIATSMVASQLGLQVAVDEDGWVREVIPRHLPRTRDTRDDERPRQRQYDDRGKGGGGRYPDPRDMDKPSHIPDEIWRDLTYDFDGWEDLRPMKARNPDKNYPDFKRQSDGKGVWLTPFRGNRGGRR